MKRVIRCIAAVLAGLVLAGCGGRADRLQTGDLVFIGIPVEYNAGGMTDAIGSATGKGELNLIHTAIAEVDAAGRPWIIDATIAHGVDRHPLDTMLRDFRLRDGYKATFIVKRLRDNRDAARYVENAKRFLGRSYNTTFLPNDTSLYCTELVHESYIAADGRPLFEEAPMNWRNADGELPEYWVWLFGQLGMDVPEGLPGTNPQTMSEAPVLRSTKVAIDQPY
jgi:hypothetical protein